MSLLACACVFLPAIGAAMAWCRWMDRREAAAPPRKPVGDRYVEWPKPVADPEPVGPDIRYAVYPPGSLGEHPETAPRPGPLSAAPGDVEGLLTGAIRHAKAHADGEWRLTAE